MVKENCQVRTKHQDQRSFQTKNSSIRLKKILYTCTDKLVTSQMTLCSCSVRTLVACKWLLNIENLSSFSWYQAVDRLIWLFPFSTFLSAFDLYMMCKRSFVHEVFPTLFTIPYIMTLFVFSEMNLYKIWIFFCFLWSFWYLPFPRLPSS